MMVTVSDLFSGARGFVTTGVSASKKFDAVSTSSVAFGKSFAMAGAAASAVTNSVHVVADDVNQYSEKSKYDEKPPKQFTIGPELLFEPVKPDIKDREDCEERGYYYKEKKEDYWKCWKFIGRKKGGSSGSGEIVLCWEGDISIEACHHLGCVYLSKIEGTCWARK